MWTLLKFLGVALFSMTSLLPLTSLATSYVARVHVHVEKSAEDKWRSATGKTSHEEFWLEMNSTFFEINELYKTMQPYGVDLQFQIADVNFMGKNILNTNNGKVQATTALSSFTARVAPFYYYGSKYDIAILYTGANLMNKESESPVGYALVGKVCSYKALGVLEFYATYKDSIITAHELGHLFGSSHDGVGKSTACKKDSGNVMQSSLPRTSPHHFFFSSCTAASVKKTIDNLNKANTNCLTNWASSGVITGPRYASLMSPDGICHRHLGPRSYIARIAYQSYGSGVCVTIKCLVRKENGHYIVGTVETPQGLVCGQNKQCIQGKCVETTEGRPSVSDSCPFGDQPSLQVLRTNITCSMMNYHRCNIAKTACCQSCEDPVPQTADKICQTLTGNTNSALVRSYYKDDGYDNLLCSQLACLSDFRGKSFRYSLHTAPSGMRCGQNKRCSEGRCVPDKFGDPGMLDSCPYGDQPWLGGDWGNTTCAQHTSLNGCSGLNDTCCASCSDPGTADEVCRRREGATSVMARFVYDSYGDNLCSQLACSIRSGGGKTRGKYTKARAPDGMKCGKNKRCSQGKCLLTVLGDPNMPDACPYGDQSGGKQSCQDLPLSKYCPNPLIKRTCCASCPGH